MNKVLSFIALLTMSAAAFAADRVNITVSNSLSTDRQFEVVETDAALIRKRLGTDSFIITDADGKEIASQTTYDGLLIFQASVPARGKSVYYAVPGTPKAYEPQAKGRLFTERGDEFGWENDRVAYRVYGHGAAVGYDLFNKSTTELMLDYWYASEQNQEMRSVSKQLHDRGYHDLADQVYNAFCYHIDHGKGMDCYTVGPTLGGGADALLNADGSLCLPQCYKTYEILDKGPLRFTVRMTHPSVTYQGTQVTETRLITLDAGSHFNRVSITFSDLVPSAQIASGIVIHKQNPNAYVLNAEAGYMGYEDLGDPSPYNKKYADELARHMGKIYVGTIYPAKVSKTQFLSGENGIATGHILAISNYTPGYTYYFGSGWDKNPNTGLQSLSDWEALLARKAAEVRTPMKVKIK
ncbi:MAG: DUF4861 domain-containing protein [Bacteroidaceae bacterium]|nr:DUF4861 domain-containing protein [Bacteroidaceae bacterium]